MLFLKTLILQPATYTCPRSDHQWLFGSPNTESMPFYCLQLWWLRCRSEPAIRSASAKRTWHFRQQWAEILRRGALRVCPDLSFLPGWRTGCQLLLNWMARLGRTGSFLVSVLPLKPHLARSGLAEFEFLSQSPNQFRGWHDAR